MDDKHRFYPKKRKDHKLRWVLLAILTTLSVFLCGQIALASRIPGELPEVRSDLKADYSPWTSAIFPGLDPGILLEALRDREGGGWSGPQRAMNCFLLNEDCEMEPTKVDEGFPVEAEATPAVLRIANSVEPDFDQPDGTGLQIQPGQEVLLDLRSTPILVTGSEEHEADILLFITPEGDVTQAMQDLQLSLALRQEGPWTPVYTGGDQTHGDNGAEIPYINGSEGAGASLEGAASSEDASAPAWAGIAIDVDASLSQSGLYGWARLSTRVDASQPVVVDALIVIADPD